MFGLYFKYTSHFKYYDTIINGEYTYNILI